MQVGRMWQIASQLAAKEEGANNTKVEFQMSTFFFFPQYNPTIPSHGGDNPPSRLCGAGAGETGETASAAASG